VKPEEEFSENIRAYVHRRMGSEEHARFGSRLKEDPALREELAAYLSYKESLAHKDVYELKKQLDGYSRFSKMEAKASAIPLWVKITGIAAAVAIAFGSFYYFYQTEALNPQFKEQILAGLGDEGLYRVQAPQSRNGKGQGNDYDLSDTLFIDLRQWFPEAVQKRKSAHEFVDHCELLLSKASYREKYESPTLLMQARGQLLLSNHKKALKTLGKLDDEDFYACPKIYYQAIALAAQSQPTEATQKLNSKDCATFKPSFDLLLTKIQTSN
jgi:hypothetical protein